MCIFVFIFTGMYVKYKRYMHARTHACIHAYTTAHSMGHLLDNVAREPRHLLGARVGVFFEIRRKLLLQLPNLRLGSAHSVGFRV